MKKIVKLTIECIKGCKIESILSIFFVTIETIAEIIIPLIMAMLIDRGIEVGDFEKIKLFSVFLFILVVIQITGGAFCAFFAVKASTVFAYNLRAEVFKKIQELSFKNIDKFSVGSLVTRSTTDIVNIKQSYQSIIRGLVRAFLMIIFSVSVSFYINKEIAKWLLLSIPFIFVSFLFIAKLAVPIFNETFKNIDKLNNKLSENIRGIRVVKSYVREEFEEENFVKLSKEIFKSSVSAERLAISWMPIMSIFIYGINVLIAYKGTMAIIESGNNIANGLTTGELMSLITYSTQMFASLLILAFLSVGILISVSSMNRIFEVLDEEPNIKNRDNAITELKNYNIEFKDVSFKYKHKAQKEVLKNINLKIEEGECVGIIGGTGSGKSSLVNLIPRLYDTTFGRVCVGNVDVRDYDIETLRKNIGMVMQKNVLFSGTVKSNLCFGKEDVSDLEIFKALEIACAKDFIEEKENGINTVVEQGGVNFSGGQRQRLCIARAIIKKPKILIFDDATASVDNETDKKIRTAMKEYLKGTTRIIISQKISSIIDCDKILVLDRGSLVGVGCHESLLKDCEIYKEICALQINHESSE